MVYFKNTWLRLGIVIAVIVTIATLLARNNADANALTHRLKDYEFKADSLRLAVKTIDVSVHHKDSILLVYLASLDKTLEELNKEAAKNKKSIEANLNRQDSIRTAYCREMAKLEQHPDECH